MPQNRLPEAVAARSMQTEIFERMVCPECGGKPSLSVARRMNGTVVEGWLTCGCGRSYPIVGTIPRMLQDWQEVFPSLSGKKARNSAPLTRYEFLKRWTQRQFGFQWTIFREMSCDFWENFFTSIGPIPPGFFKGKYGLDAGCGFGRHLIQAARCGARMVGIDYSCAIESSFENTRAFPEIALVQADLEHLPFGRDSFDFVYSIGVLHHLPDPFRGFSSLTRHVKPGGAVIVWCYSDRRRWTIRLLESVRLFTKRLPLGVLRWLSVGVALMEWLFFVIPYRVLPEGKVKNFFSRSWPRLKVYEPYPLQVFCADWFDRLAAPVRHYYSASSLEKWCADLGLTNVRVTPTGLYGWTLYAQRPSHDGPHRLEGIRPIAAKPLRALVLSPIPKEGAGARFRIYQYIPALEANGFEVTVQPFLTPELFQIIYQTGHNFRKTSLLMKQTLARLRLLLQRSEYDLFFIYREAFPIGPPAIEMLLAQMKDKPLLYDFDDAVFLPNHIGTRLRSFLKHPQKVPQILRVSSQVLAGNGYLADYARRYNNHVQVIPTCIDTTKFVPFARGDSDRSTGPLSVGWIGSHTTAKYLEDLLPVLRRAACAHPFRLYVVGSATPIRTPGLEVIQVPWVLSREVEDFQRCDVGVYPLRDDDWCRGKCGFKAIQFMACGVPVVASAIGVNREIIRDGENGFLAATEGEWVEKIQRLLSDPNLRKRLGEAGRQTIEERYSLAVYAEKVVDTFRQTVEHARTNHA